MDKKRTYLQFLFATIFLACPTTIFADSTFSTMKEIESHEKTSIELKKLSAEDVLKKPKYEYTASDLRDPFFLEEKKPNVPIQTSSEDTGTEQQQGPLGSLSNFSVSGIIWGGPIPQAIINDHVVKVGDTLEGAQIIEIGKTGVIVSYMNRQYNLTSPADDMMQNFQKEPKGGKK